MFDFLSLQFRSDVLQDLGAMTKQGSSVVVLSFTLAIVSMGSVLLVVEVVVDCVASTVGAENTGYVNCAI